MQGDDKPSVPHPLSPSPSRGEGWGERVRSIDHKALAGAVGLMCLSWAALPVVYWLIVRKKNDEKANKKESRQ